MEFDVEESLGTQRERDDRGSKKFREGFKFVFSRRAKHRKRFLSVCFSGDSVYLPRAEKPGKLGARTGQRRQHAATRMEAVDTAVRQPYGSARAIVSISENPLRQPQRYLTAHVSKSKRVSLSATFRVLRQRPFGDAVKRYRSTVVKTYQAIRYSRKARAAALRRFGRHAERVTSLGA